MTTKQPKGLSLLFFTELWERFGFYMVQAILILYLTQELLYSDTSAYLLYGAFSSMLYLSPVLGGYLADKYLGFKATIQIGAVFLFFGYLIMAMGDAEALKLGLAIIVIGNGLFKPNISSILGDLYQENDPRRESGFTYFYMGINLGSLLPPLFAGTLVAAYFWGAGFLVAALGIIISFTTFMVGKHILKKAGEPPLRTPLNRQRFKFYAFFLLAAAVLIVLLQLLFHYPEKAAVVLLSASISVIGALLYFLYKEEKEDRNRLIACLTLILLSIGFWAIYIQTFTSLMLFADRNVDKVVFGYHLDTEFIQFFNPFFIILLSPVLSIFWLKLNRIKKNPSTPLKFAIGTLLMALGFFILYLGTYLNRSSGFCPLGWLACSYFFQTIGELLLSPIGLAMVTRLSPKRLTGMMMGVWFLTLALSFSIGSYLATLAATPANSSPIASLAIYSRAFLTFSSISLILGLFTLFLVPILNRLIGHTPLRTPTPKA